MIHLKDVLQKMKQFFSISSFKDHNDTCPIKALDEIRDVLLSM